MGKIRTNISLRLTSRVKWMIFQGSSFNPIRPLLKSSVAQRRHLWLLTSVKTQPPAQPPLVFSISIGHSLIHNILISFVYCLFAERQYSAVAKPQTPEPRQSWFLLPTAVWSWASYLTSLSLSCLICKLSYQLMGLLWRENEFMCVRHIETVISSLDQYWTFTSCVKVALHSQRTQVRLTYISVESHLHLVLVAV